MNMKSYLVPFLSSNTNGIELKLHQESGSTRAIYLVHKCKSKDNLASRKVKC